MESTTAKKKTCATCHKAGDVFTCRGCRLDFCAKHVDDHRSDLSKEIHHLIEEYDLLRRDCDQDEESQTVLATLNTWEQESIAKICLAAEAARVELSEWDERNREVKSSVEKVIGELETCQKSDDFTELDLKRWNLLLDDLRRKLEILPTVNRIDDPDVIHLVTLNGDLNQTDYNQLSHSTPTTTTSSDISYQELPNLLVREHFDDVVGGATLHEEGLVATYSGPWMGSTSICGVNRYSSGTHHIRFRILEKFYDAPFIGIITSTQRNSPHILESISTNGWLNFDCVIANGTRDSRVSRDKLLRTMDELTLTIDCDRRQIFLKHHRTKRLLHLPIELRACPFPWKMLVVLHRRRDSIRIVGGTLSLTRENLSSRLSDKRAT